MKKILVKAVADFLYKGKHVRANTEVLVDEPDIYDLVRKCMVSSVVSKVVISKFVPVTKNVAVEKEVDISEDEEKVIQNPSLEGKSRRIKKENRF